MTHLYNRKKVKELLLDLSNSTGKKNRVAQSAFDAIDAAIRKAASQIVNHHDNRTSSRKTIV